MKIKSLKLSLVTFGWIHYPNEKYPGIYISVEEVSNWYTTAAGEFKEWRL